ncbi:MAG: S8 family serine peptidase [Cyclobacteriaceae bacterium]
MFLIFYHSANYLIAQKQSEARFKFPSHVSPKDYQQDKILVKLKKEFKDHSLDKIVAGARKKIQMLNLSPVLNENMQMQLAARARPLKSPINRIYEMQLPAGINIEQAINLALNTGYFEEVEPAYIYQSSDMPNDEKLRDQYYLQNIKALQAWDINTGSDQILIAIVDSGVDLDHPDLKDRIFYNENDPVDGIDNDNDGYVDNYAGWDFVGSYHGNPMQDNDPSVNSANLNHGTLVAGLAAASGDNDIGIAGVSFKSRLLITKHSGDDKQADINSIVDGYQGIIYAANHGAHIINCSWGGPFYSRIVEDIINYAVEDMNAIVVAAAGNENSDQPVYPAAFANVLSVTALDEENRVSAFANTGATVNIAAPGEGLLSTDIGGAYKQVNGTSFSASLVSGAAALVRSQHPDLKARQVMEIIRVAADESIYNDVSNPKNKLGKGILDVEAALVKQLPGIRLDDVKILNKEGKVAHAGDTAYITADFTNYLWRSSEMLKANIIFTSSQVGIVQQEVHLGKIETNKTIVNHNDPFVIYIDENAETNMKLEVEIRFSDGEYNDFQLLSLTMNPDFLTIKENLITTTVAGNGRLGFYDYYDQLLGEGFKVDGENVLFEMGLIMGTSEEKIVNNVRRSTDSADVDFVATQKVKEFSPGQYSSSEVTGQFNDENAGDSKLGLLVNYRSMVWKDEPFNKFVIIEYQIKNNSSMPASNFHVGIFADWDISEGGQRDQAKFADPQKLGYVYNTNNSNKIYAGVQALNEPAGCFSSGSSFLFDGFSDAEKFNCISTNFDNLNEFSYNDVSQTVWQGPFEIPVGESITIAFALHGSKSEEQIINSAKFADSLYNYTLKAPVPLVKGDTVCYGEGGTIAASNANQYHWYTSFTGGEKIATGSTFSFPQVKSDTAFYVANADNSYESVRARANIKVEANPNINILGDKTFCAGDSVILKVNNADEYLWNNGATSQSLIVKETGSYHVTVASRAHNCKNSSETPINTTVLPSARAKFEIGSEFILRNEDVVFNNLSTDAEKYFWNFGDGLTSTLENPVHQYDLNNDYTVNLTATHKNGCSSTYTRILQVVTGTSALMADKIKVYPNPAINNEVFLKLPPSFGQTVFIQFINNKGIVIKTMELINEKTIRIDLPANLNESLLFLRIYNQDYKATFKIIR